MAVHEIARRLIGGVWRTVDVEEDGGGNGGSQTNPITVAVPLEIDQTDAAQDDLVVIKIPAGYVDESGYGWLLRATFDPDTPGDYVFAAELQQLAFRAPADEGPGSLHISAADYPNNSASYRSDGISIVGDGAGIAVADGGVTVFRVNNVTGFMFRGSHAAPTDNTLAAGDIALWFDQTNGAAKLMIKGKSADGTVVTGAVALT